MALSGSDTVELKLTVPASSACGDRRARRRRARGPDPAGVFFDTPTSPRPGGRVFHARDPGARGDSYQAAPVGPMSRGPPSAQRIRHRVDASRWIRCSGLCRRGGLRRDPQVGAASALRNSPEPLPCTGPPPTGRAARSRRPRADFMLKLKWHRQCTKRSRRSALPGPRPPLHSPTNALTPRLPGRERGAGLNPPRTDRPLRRAADQPCTALEVCAAELAVA